MKIFFSAAFILMAVFSSFAQQDKVNSFLDNWHNAAARADGKAYFDAIADDGIYIGTDKSERWTKEEFYQWSKKYFDAGKAWSFKAKNRHVYFSGDDKMAWFDEIVDNGKTEWRGSGVLELTDNGWKIKQYVLSVPVPNEIYPEVFEMIKKYESRQPAENHQPH
jgi:ketosteroid isomerase-like protein